MEEENLSFEWVRPIESHAYQVMEWRNDPQTLRMSYHHELKRWDAFLDEFKEEYCCSSRIPPLFVLLKGERIAFLRFSDLGEAEHSKRLSCEISINISPKFRGRRLSGKILKEAALLLKRQRYDDIYAEIRKENIVSQKSFERAGYRLLGEFLKEVEDTGEKCKIFRYVFSLSPRKEMKKKSVFIIAEAGSNWRMGNFERDLSMAKELIDVASEAGADAVKFQTYRHQKVYVENAGKSDYLSKLGIKRDINEIFKDLSMSYEMIPYLTDYCSRNKISFMSTPFSLEDFHAVDPYVKRHKIASYEISHLRLIEAAAMSGKPLIVSTGASVLDDLFWLVETFKKNSDEELTLMQCTARYPAESDTMNLLVIPKLRNIFNVPVGLSDHSRHPTNAPVAAVALGAEVIEKHYTLSSRLPGPDHAFAIHPEELKEMVEAIRSTESMLGDGVKKIGEKEEELHKYARRGIQAKRFIKKGEILKEGENIDILRPGKQRLGIHPKRLAEIEGGVSIRDIPLGMGIQEGDWKRE